MQFKGSVRAPGDRDPGVRVVLDIDEYHLEIRRDSELFGRYYLADVEVARDIAERFVLFLGDDEVEFLADDALQFAYGGVTAMQDAWLEAQKKKRRHRRAAEAAARRKDDEPHSVDLETPVTAQPLHVSESDAVRRRRVQAGAPTRPVPSPGRQAPAARAPSGATPPADNGNVARNRKEPTAADLIREVKDPTSRRKAPPMPPLPDPATFDMAEDALVDETILDEPVPEEAVAEPAESENFEEIDETEIEDTSLAARRRKITDRSKPEARREPKREARAKPKPTPKPETKPASVREPESEAIPEPQSEAIVKARPDQPEVTPEPQPDSTQRQAQPKESDLGRVRVPEAVSAKAAQPAAGVGPKDIAEPVGETADGLLETARGVRFAQQGHHPSETSTGLLAKLRGQPRRPSNHVHSFKESGSSVGLVRRVCTECAYVSIGSED